MQPYRKRNIPFALTLALGKAFRLNPAIQVLTCAKTGIISDVNLQFEKFYGCKRQQVLGKTLLQLNIFANPRQREHIRQLVLRKKHIVNYEVLEKRKNGQQRWVNVSVQLISAGGRKFLLGSGIDVTEKKLAEEAVKKQLQHSRSKFRHSEQLLANALNNMLEGVQIISRQWKFLYVNDTVVKHVRQSREQLLGKTMMEQYPGIEKTPMFSVLKKCMQEKTSARMDNEFTYPDGKKGWLELSIHPIQQGLLILSIDNTEKKRAEEKLLHSREKLRLFAAHLNHKIEEEHASIAREIHDELGQLLAGIKMRLSVLQKKAMPENAENISGMIADTDKTIQSLREISTRLRPGILDTMGLVASLHWLVGEFEKKSQIFCTLNIFSEPRRFSPVLSTAFFRICQEALTNILKHSCATRAEVELEFDETKKILSLRVKDNGKGIERKKLINPFSMGLLGMRERARHIGGKLHIESSEGQGTTITLKAKIKEK